MLCEENERINPAIILAEELMRKTNAGGFYFDDIERTKIVLNESRREIETVNRQFEAFEKLPASPSRIVPKGF